MMNRNLILSRNATTSYRQKCLAFGRRLELFRMYDLMRVIIILIIKQNSLKVAVL